MLSIVLQALFRADNKLKGLDMYSEALDFAVPFQFFTDHAQLLAMLDLQELENLRLLLWGELPTFDEAQVRQDTTFVAQDTANAARFLASVAPSLKDLTIDTKLPHFSRGYRTCQTNQLYAVLFQAHFPKLEGLTLYYGYVERKGLMEFFVRHKDTLKNYEFEDVIEYGAPTEAIGDSDEEWDSKLQQA